MTYSALGTTEADVLVLIEGAFLIPVISLKEGAKRNAETDWIGEVVKSVGRPG
jgi:hypothetical protein